VASRREAKEERKRMRDADVVSIVLDIEGGGKRGVR
jgi:hypothetical protein